VKGDALPLKFNGEVEKVVLRTMKAGMK